MDGRRSDHPWKFTTPLETGRLFRQAVVFHKRVIYLQSSKLADTSALSVFISFHKSETTRLHHLQS